MRKPMLWRSSFYAQKCTLTAKKCSTMLSLDFSMLIILAIPEAGFVLHAQEIMMTEAADLLYTMLFQLWCSVRLKSCMICKYFALLSH